MRPVLETDSAAIHLGGSVPSAAVPLDRRGKRRLEVLAGRARSGWGLAEALWGCPVSGGVLAALLSPLGDAGWVGAAPLGTAGPVLRRDVVWRLRDRDGLPVGTTRALVAVDLLEAGVREALDPGRPAVPLERVLADAGVVFTRRVLEVEHDRAGSAWFGPLREARPGAGVLRVTRWWCLPGRPLGADRLAVLVDELAVPRSDR